MNELAGHPTCPGKCRESRTIPLASGKAMFVNIRQSSPAKASRPSRAYLHLTKQEYLGPLTEKIRDTSFTDTPASTHDAALQGPPTVEFAPYGRIPSTKARKDARQGTIDQDPDFIDFLESLTNPTVKPAPPDTNPEPETKKGDAVTVTPLIQYLRDKKANKIKEPPVIAKSIKHARHDSKDSKTSSQASDKKVAPKNAKVVSSTSVEKRSASAVKVEKAARDAVKVLTKHAAGGSNRAAAADTAPPTPPPAKAPSTPTASPAPPATTDRKRGSASAAAKILQRDLALAGAPAGRRRREAPVPASSAPASPAPKTTIATASSPPAGSPSSTATTDAPETPASDPAPPSTVPVHPPTGPAASRPPPKTIPAPRHHNTNSTRPTPTTQHHSPSSSKPAVPSTTTATQAFLKHANPSQGITEPLLEQAFATFGAVAKVEIDKKKGFAYLDFREPEGLQKAIRASPVKVGQGQVVVLERKVGGAVLPVRGRGGFPMGPRGGGGGGRGGGRGGRGGGGGGSGAARRVSTSHHGAGASTGANASASANGNAKGSTSTSAETGTGTGTAVAGERSRSGAVVVASPVSAAREERSVGALSGGAA